MPKAILENFIPGQRLSVVESNSGDHVPFALFTVFLHHFLQIGLNTAGATDGVNG
jgi:hypothetical protein